MSARTPSNDRSLYRHGFARMATCTIDVRLAEPERNVDSILAQARACHADGVAVAVFAELCVTGYSIDDLFLADRLLRASDVALGRLVTESAHLTPVLIVGAPIQHRHRLYNTAVVIHRGRVLGVAPKSLLPTYREFYERRHFAPGDDQRGQECVIDGYRVPFGPDLLFEAEDVPGLVLHAEVCEDMWVPIPPSAEAALAGATVIANLSGSPITVGRADERHLLCRSASTRCLAAYLYGAAGAGESSNDLAWDGQTMIYEAGRLLAETPRFSQQPERAVADVDLDLLRQDRLRQGTFDDNRRTHAVRTDAFRRVQFRLNPSRDDLGLRRTVDRFPFVPDDEARLAQDCYEAFNIQVAALEQRMRAIGAPKLVIGVSGGLDSTHAMLVAAQAMDRLGRPRTDILGYTMPGFATSDHTKANAWALGEALGVTFAEIDITPAAREMLEKIGHPFADSQPAYDVTFENVQAGLRTDYLFRIANSESGIVVGTGDLSEMALGWCTYGVGDQMSHYAVNVGVPKTMIQHLIRWVIAAEQFSAECSRVLQAVLDTRITPELIPSGEDGVEQSTEDTIGPYALHDFSLFYVLRYGFSPNKIAFLAEHAWSNEEAGTWPPGFPTESRYNYQSAEIRRWLEVFVKRFFGFSQFKRTAIPNGPKVAAGGALSPRGEWRAPSDSTASIWLDELHRSEQSVRSCNSETPPRRNART